MGVNTPFVIVVESKVDNKVRANLTTRSIWVAAKLEYYVISNSYRKRKAELTTHLECRVVNFEIQAA
jgi:hypothetical protein